MLYLSFQNEIERALPSGGSSRVANNPAAQQLRKMMEEVEAIKAEREVIENTLKEASFDMGTWYRE